MAASLPMSFSSGREVVVASLCTPVNGATLRRPQSIRLQDSMRTFASVAATSGRGLHGDRGALIEEVDENTRKDVLDVWARYGFLDSQPCRRRRESNTNRGDGNASNNSRALPGRRAGPDSHKQEQRASESRSTSSTTARDVNEFAASTPASLDYVRGRDVGAALESTTDAAAAVGAGHGPQQVASRPPSPDDGTITPQTVILTPASQDRNRLPIARTAAGQAIIRRAENGMLGLPRDSLAAAIMAVSTATASRPAFNSEPMRTRGEVENGRARVGIGNQRIDLRTGESLGGEAEEMEDGGSSVECAAPESRQSSSSGSGHVRPAWNRAPQSITEAEILKRTRAERLRVYGCSRTLYPRICPSTESGNPVTEQTETEQWVETLRFTIPLRGECFVPAFTHVVGKERRAMLLEEAQADVRASRAADVSNMEGSDGLLHCAVLKGNHPLAARAAQFLVDKGGASVNSRDEWNRTPLHSACGKGVVSMARFFIRRGANVDALDVDNRSPLFFACAGGHATMARYLTRIEVGARVDIRDARGHLPGEFFWEDVSQSTQEEIAAILEAVGWPHPPPRAARKPRGRSMNRRRAEGWRSLSRSDRRQPRSPGRRARLDGHARSASAHAGESGWSRGNGQVGMKRLTGEMRSFVRGL